MCYEGSFVAECVVTLVVDTAALVVFSSHFFNVFPLRCYRMHPRGARSADEAADTLSSHQRAYW